MNDPIFIVGNSRSGTTLLARIIKNHPEVYVLNETHFMEEFENERLNFNNLTHAQICKLINQMITIQRKDYYRKSEYEEYPYDAERIIDEFYKQKNNNFATLIKVFFDFEAKRHGKHIFGDQTPRHVFYVHELIEMFPEAKFIHMVRDPRAVLLSQKRKWKAGLRWKHPKFEIFRTFINHHPITTTIIWNKSISAGFKAQNSFHKNSIKTIFYEQLVQNPSKTVKSICSFLGIQFFPEMLNVDVELSASKKEDGKKGIRKSIAQTWKKELSETEIYLTERFAGSKMKEIGYNITFANPNIFLLIIYLMIWPFQLFIAFALNLGRMGNPFTYITKRLFQKQEI